MHAINGRRDWCGVMWIHLDLLDENGQWTNASRKKSKGNSKMANIIIASTIEPNSDVNSLTDIKKEELVLATEATGPLTATTRSGQPHLRKYYESQPEPLEQTQKPVKKLIEHPKTMPEKLREVGGIDPSIKAKRWRKPNPSVLTSLTNWPASWLESTPTSICNCQSQPERL